MEIDKEGVEVLVGIPVVVVVVDFGVEDEEKRFGVDTNSADLAVSKDRRRGMLPSPLSGGWDAPRRCLVEGQDTR